MRRPATFIDGQFDHDSVAGLIDVTDPATGTCVGQVPAASEAQVVRAVEAAARAQVAWRGLPAIQRGDRLRALADALERRADAIAEALVLESGKSAEDARAEVHYAAEITRYHAEWARRVEGELIPSDVPGELLMLQREPLGVVVCLVPFNFPVYTLLRKIAPALITGNTVVIRPSNTTPLCAFEIAHAIIDSGLPAGVANILAMTHPVAATLCTLQQVAMITLTGSLHAGRMVLEYCKENMARPSLELGGKTPVIVHADADLDAAADAIVASRTRHCGQLCTSAERVYVHADVHDALLARLLQRMQALDVADRRVTPSAMGPLANAASRTRVHALVEAAGAAGARVLCGGTVPDGPGWFYPPTLLADCTQDMAVIREETFGPVLPVVRVESLEQALALANDHQFGLASVLFTADYRAALQVASGMQAGEVYINRAPADAYQGYHAGWKRSGMGGDDGKHGMLEFTQTRLVVLPR